MRYTRLRFASTVVTQICVASAMSWSLSPSAARSATRRSVGIRSTFGPLPTLVRASSAHTPPSAAGDPKSRRHAVSYLVSHCLAHISLLWW